MGIRYNLWSFYLCLLCVVLTFYLIYSNVSTVWSVAPPVYILLLLAILSFVAGILGFKKNKSCLADVRSWFTVLVSLFLSFILLLVMVFIPEGKQLIDTTQSPDHNYTINIYRTNGGAATSFGIKGELDGPLWFRKTIYAQYRMDHADIKWKNNYTVSINNHKLNLHKGQTYSD